MSEIKFSCPYCSQHLVCDDVFCGERIECPGCGKELFVPPRATFIPLQSGNLTFALPVASKQQPPVIAASPDLTHGHRGSESAPQNREDKFPVLLPFWLLLFFPFVFALLTATQRGGLRSIEYVFILCAIAAGFYLAAVQKKTDAWVILRGILYAIAMLFVFVVVGVGLLFVGCLVLLSSHR